MKKTLKGLAICGFVLAGPTAFAADLSLPIGTTGDITFEIDDNPTTEIVVPNEKNEVPEIIELPNEGKSGSGAIRVEFVPNFRFGTSNNMTAGQDIVKAKTIEYQFKGEVAKHDIAPFVQVRDGRGKVGADAKWVLTVKASPFTAKDANGPGADDVLADVTIKLGGSTLTMDYGDSAKANGLVSGQANNAVLATNNTPITVMETKADQSTSGHRVSNVFDNSYTKGKAYGTKEASDIEFIKAAGKAPVAGATYASTLTWTVTDGK